MKSGTENTIYYLVAYAAERSGSVTAITDGSHSMSYAELFQRTVLLAAGLQREGYSGRLVELFPVLNMDFLVAFLALSMAGATVVLHEPGIKIEKLKISVYKAVSPEEITAIDPGEEKNYTFSKLDENCVLIFTSGTTGTPKGVLLSQANLVKDVIQGYEAIGNVQYEPGEYTIPVLPVFHMFSITASLLVPIYSRLTMYFVDSITHFMKTIPIVRPLILFVVPVIAKGILRKADELKAAGYTREQIREKLFGGVKIIVAGGAVLSEVLVKRYQEYGIQLLNGYGITECSPVVTVCNMNYSVAGSVGNVNSLKYTTVRIFRGRVCIRGDIVMKGYYTDEPDPFVTIDGERYFNTGDFGRIDHEGNLFITGREANLIVMEDGNNISPEEIERRFDCYNEIEEVLVYKETKNKCDFLGIKILLKEEFRKIHTEAEMKDRLSEIVREVNSVLTPYKRIRFIINQQEPFIHTKTGKISRTQEFTFESGGLKQ